MCASVPLLLPPQKEKSTSFLHLHCLSPGDMLHLLAVQGSTTAVPEQLIFNGNYISEPEPSL